MATLEHVRLAEAIRMELAEELGGTPNPCPDAEADAYDEAFGRAETAALNAADALADAALETMAVYLTLSGQLEAAKLLRSWRS